MASFIGELILPVVDPEMLLIPKVNEAVVASSAIRMDNAFQADPSSNDCLEGRPAAIRHVLGINSPLALEDTENNRLGACSTPSKDFDSASSKVALV